MYEDISDDVTIGGNAQGTLLAGLAKDPAARPAGCAGVLGGVAARAAAAPRGDATERVPQNADVPAPRGPSSRGGSEADAIRARVEAKIQQRRLPSIPDGEGFVAKKAELEETLLRGEMFFEANLWGDAERAFTAYIEGIAELERLDAVRKASERERQRRAEEKRLAAQRKAGDVKLITLPSGTEMRFRWCPPGSFMMGSPETESDRDDNEVQHPVTLTKGFWMAETEVTQKQWVSVMGYIPSRYKGDNLPVEHVSWEDCQEFIAKANKEQGLGLRLPTEAEWEYACRAGTTGTYGGTGDLDEIGWYWNNSKRKTHPVGQKKPNAWGLYDMHGNVWEWCADWYIRYPSWNVMNPTGPASGVFRVFRGGFWGIGAEGCRSACRNGIDPDYRGINGGGFRLVCSAGPRG